MKNKRFGCGPMHTLARGCVLGIGVLLLTRLALPAGEQTPESKKVIGVDGEKWTSLFDGQSLGKWQVVDKYDFNRHGKVAAEGGCIVLESGSPCTGIRWGGEFPKTDYELAWEAKRVEGGDFFCGLTFPVGDTALTLILGGWGGWVCGLSCIEGERAAENETITSIQFEQDRWYHVRVRVAKSKILVWVDDKETVEFDCRDRKINVDLTMEPCLPLGVATYYTTGALRNIQFRSLDEKPAQP